MNCVEILDIGCGAGMYVAALRRFGFHVAGYDSNPFTKQLSTSILTNFDEPCGIANLVGNIENDETFDFVMCVDVLPYISIENGYLEKAISNLSKLSSKSILLVWNHSFDEKKEEKKLIFTILNEAAFFEDKFATKFFKSMSQINPYAYIFVKS